MTCPARILVVTADMGGGHNATARALQERALALWPGCDIRWVDTLDVMGPGVGPLFRRIYVVNVQQTPWLYEFFYRSLLRWRWFASSSKRFVGAWSGRRLQRTIDDYAPQLILSVYPLGSAGLEWLRRHRGMQIPTGAWVSDFAPHPFWVYRDLDLHLVMHETAIAPALRAEPRASVEVCAPPVTSNFAPGNRDQARARLCGSADGFLALVSTGAYGFGDVDVAVSALLAADPSVQVVVACGRNEKLRARLRARNLPAQRLRALGWVQDMASWMRAVDVVVTNARGATSLESLVCGTPVVMFDPIAAHGRANAELMAESGLALLCPTRGELTDTVRRLLAQPAELSAIRAAIEAHLARHDLDSALLQLNKLSGTAVGAAGSGAPYRQAREQPLRSADAFFLHVETPLVAQQVGAVLILDPVDGRPPEPPRVLEMLAERVPQLPTLRKVLRTRPPPRAAVDRAGGCGGGRSFQPSDAGRTGRVARRHRRLLLRTPAPQHAAVGHAAGLRPGRAAQRPVGQAAPRARRRHLGDRNAGRPAGQQHTSGNGRADNAQTYSGRVAFGHHHPRRTVASGPGRPCACRPGQRRVDHHPAPPRAGRAAHLRRSETGAPAGGAQQ